jgi:two-component system cell cycle response regulator CpdR
MPENRILLIEDEATSRELLTYVLEGEGYAVDAVETAAAAIAQLESTQYTLVIADWLLPDGNGIDLADHAAKLGAKTFIVSGYLIGLPAGAAERHVLFRKPVRPEELAEAVQQAIGPAAGSP